METIKQILKNSHYQTFDLIPNDKRDSDSKLKYILSLLDFYPLQDKSILDIGCNAGYFLFKLINRNPSKLTGIEIGEKFVSILNELNDKVYKSSLINVILGDIFTHKFNEKFDFIICFSTFHYFGHNQEKFFKICHELLNDNCTLLLEVEEYPEGKYPMIDIDPRDTDRLYPNELMLQRYIKDQFKVLNKYMSVKQKGGVYDRWFYELRKI